MAINGVYTQMEQRAVQAHLLAAGGVAFVIAEAFACASTVYAREIRTRGALFLFCGGNGDRCLVAKSMVLNETDGSMLDESAMLRGGVLAYSEVRTGRDGPMEVVAIPTAGSVWSTWDGAEQWTVDPLVSAATTPEAPDLLRVVNAAPILGIDVNGAYVRARFRVGGYAAYALASPFNGVDNATTLQLQLFIFHDKTSGAWHIGRVDAGCEDPVAAATTARAERCVASRSTFVLASAVADPAFPHLPALACPGARGGGLSAAAPSGANGAAHDHQQQADGAPRWQSAPHARASTPAVLNLSVAAPAPWCFGRSGFAGAPSSGAAKRASGTDEGAAGAARADSGWGAWSALRRATEQISTDAEGSSRFGSRDILSWILALTLGLSTFAAPVSRFLLLAARNACGKAKKKTTGRAKKKGKASSSDGAHSAKERAKERRGKAARRAAATATATATTVTTALPESGGDAARAATVVVASGGGSIDPGVLERHFGRGVVEMLTCPITKAVLIDPVRTPQGIAFGRAALEKRFAKSNDGAMSCPVTRETITRRDISADDDLAAAIDIFGALGRMLDASGSSASMNAGARGSGRGKSARRGRKGKSGARR
jgi:hypothetical protein